MPRSPKPPGTEYAAAIAENGGNICLCELLESTHFISITASFAAAAWLPAILRDRQISVMQLNIFADKGYLHCAVRTP